MQIIHVDIKYILIFIACSFVENWFGFGKL